MMNKHHLKKREYTLKSGLDKEISKIIVKDLKEFSKKYKALFKMNLLELVLKKRRVQDAISFLKEKIIKYF